MDRQTAAEKLTAAGLRVITEMRTGAGDGWRLRLESDVLVTCLDSGTVTVRGRNQEPVRVALSLPLDDTPADAAARSRKILLVAGENAKASVELQAMLRQRRLDPLVLDQALSGGPTIVEELQRLRAEVRFAVLLASPDDEGHRAGRAHEKAFRARQSVVLTLGMLLASFGRSRVAILLRRGVAMDPPSDIEGLRYIPYGESLAEAEFALAQAILAEEITPNAPGRAAET
ncbi:MAG: nucleotide-binding protein [Rhodospirillales bacterium]|nr:nucleotide-binding protein [Rhodospirillales bacterium]